MKLLTKKNGQGIDALYEQLRKVNIKREKEKFLTIIGTVHVLQNAKIFK